MKFTYNGTDERTFPSIAITVSPGDSFDAPDDFSATDVTPTTNKVATPDPTVGDE
jgi:hypothetical protein